MRFCFTLVPMLAVFGAWSCQSTPSSDEPSLQDQSSATDYVNGDVRARDPGAPVEAAARVPSQDPDQFLGQEAERIALLRERQEVLSKQYLAQGDTLLEQGDLTGALAQYSEALDVMPSSTAARAGIRKVETLMGNRFAAAADFVQDAAAQETVRRAQARMSAEQATLEGKSALAAGDYDRAIDRFREAQLILRYHPLIETDSLNENVVSSALAEAVRMQAEGRAAEVERSKAEAAADVVRREAESREYRLNQVKQLYNKAHQAFLAEDYARAETLANQILVEDPGNEHAAELRDTAQEAKHAKTDEVARRNYREQWQRTFEELDTMDVPQTESVVFDDLARWRDVSARQPLEFAPTASVDQGDKQAVLDRLESVRFAPHFVGPEGAGSPITEIATFLQNLSGVNFLVSVKVQELDDEAKTIKLDLPERSVRTVLMIIQDTSESIRWKIEDGVVKFVAKDELLGGQVLEMYSVQDLIHPVPNYPGREININPSTDVDQPEDTTTAREGLVVTSEALEALIRDNIAPESWNEDPKNAVRITEAGAMVVNQTPEVQQQIKALLEDLREATGIMVDIQANFLKVEDNFLEDIGVDLRGLGQPGLGTNTRFNDFGDPGTQTDLGAEIGQGSDLGAFYDHGFDGDIRSRVENLYDIGLGNQDVLTGTGGLSFSWTYLNDLQAELILRAVSKSERKELVTSPRLLVFNTARAHLAVLNQVAYVRDFDVEIAQAASIADPIVDVIQDGVVLDVRPVVSADRRFIMMELRPTVAQLKRPIEEVATTLGSQNSVAIQLPEIDLQKVRTTVPLPDGGTVMLGGLKVSEKQDQRSGVPILSKIPLVRMLFERKGTFNSNRKLLILLRAAIVIPTELEPTPAQYGR